MKHDLGIAQRFKEFRKKHVDNNIKLAGPILGISKSKLSDIENGKNAMDMGVVKLLQKNHKLNESWLIRGEGNMLADDTTKKSSLQRSIEMGDRINALSAEVLILSKNLNRAWQIIERHEKEIERLSKKS